MLSDTNGLPRDVIRLNIVIEIKKFASTKILNGSTRTFSLVICFSRCGAKGIFEISICSKGTEDPKRKERNGKAEESKGEERSSCVYCMRDFTRV